MTVLCDVLRAHWPPCEPMPLTVGRRSSHLAHTWRGLWDWRHSGTWLVSGADPHLNGCKSPMLRLLSAQRSPSPLGQSPWGNRSGWPAGRFRGVCNRHERWSKMWLQKTERNEWKGECLLNVYPDFEDLLEAALWGCGQTQDSEMADESGGHGVAAPSWRSTGRCNGHLLKRKDRGREGGQDIKKRRLIENESESTSRSSFICLLLHWFWKHSGF